MVKIRIFEGYRLIRPKSREPVEKHFYAKGKNKGSLGILKYGTNLGKYSRYYNYPKRFHKYFKNKDASVNLVAVRSGSKNKGVGRKLLKKAEREAKKERKKNIYLYVNRQNKKPISLYKKLGYKEIDKSREEGQGWSLLKKVLK